MLTRQEVFNTVCDHLMKQGEQAVDDREDCESSCMYRVNGLMCAAGCLILDEHYNINLEHCSVDTPRVALALLNSGVCADDMSLVSTLQYTHDWHLPAQWANHLRKIAMMFRLDVPNSIKESTR